METTSPSYATSSCTLHQLLTLASRSVTCSSSRPTPSSRTRTTVPPPSVSPCHPPVGRPTRALDSSLLPSPRSRASPSPPLQLTAPSRLLRPCPRPTRRTMETERRLVPTEECKYPSSRPGAYADALTVVDLPSPRSRRSWRRRLVRPWWSSLRQPPSPPPLPPLPPPPPPLPPRPLPTATSQSSLPWPSDSTCSHKSLSENAPAPFASRQLSTRPVHHLRQTHHIR